MKRSIFLISCLTILITGCSQKNVSDQNKKQIIYTCAMHPQIRRTEPGNCPICGMKLVPLEDLPQSSVEQTNPSYEENSHERATITLKPAQDSVASIGVVKSTEHTLIRDVQIFGEIRYDQNKHVDYTWVYGGRIQKYHIPYTTTEVTQGEPLLDIYSDEAIADEQAYLQAVRNRYLTTFYERKIATAQIEAYRAKLMQAGMTEEELKNLVDKGKIKTTFTLCAPISGSIVAPPPHLGEWIKPDMVLYHISPLDEVWFAAQVFEQDLSALKMGQTIDIETKVRPGKKYSGKLIFIDRVIDPQTRTILARFEIPNPERELLPDMSAIGFLHVKTPVKVLAIPSSAIIDTGKRKIVYIQKGTSYEQREIQAGVEGYAGKNKNQNWTEIKSGLEIGEPVVTSGAFLVDAEAQLQNIGNSTH